MFHRLLGLSLMAASLACTAYRAPDPTGATPPDPAPALGNAVIIRASLPTHLSDEQADEFLARLREDLISTHLFESVEIGEALGTHAIAVRPEYQPRHCFGEPLITVITLGVVPYPGCYYSGYRLILSGRPLSRDVVVDNRSNPLALWGWVAGPISLLPGWSWNLPTGQERQNLRFSIQSAVAGA